MKQTDPRFDPKGLIHDSYRIEGITEAECRSIFLDWALSLPEGQDAREAIAVMLDRHEAGQPDHPMTEVMRQGRERSRAPRRRGGWRGRPRDG